MRTPDSHKIFIHETYLRGESVSNLYAISDNATVAALVTVILGAFLAGWAYRRQKNIDREYAAKDKLVESVFLLEEHCKAVNQSIDRLAVTHMRIQQDNDKEAYKVFAETSLKEEVTIAAEVLMYRIPEDMSRIATFANYFDENVSVKIALQAVFDEVRAWHNFVQKYITGETSYVYRADKRVESIPELSLVSLNVKIKFFIKSF